MLVKNASKSNILSENAEVCDTTLKKFIGLMLSKNRNRFLVFKFNKELRISLHMLFVFYPIDVIFLNDKKAVVDLKENFMPFTFYTSKNPALYCIECPAGTIKKTKTEIKNKINFSG